MTGGLVEKRSEALISMMNMEFHPVLIDDEYATTTYTKLPLSRIPALGVAFEPIIEAVQKVFSAPGTVSSLCKVTIPSNTHLAAFRNGKGFLGAALNENNQIAAQAVINPLVCNPTMIFMAATLANVDKKLETIQQMQQEMLDYLKLKERADLRGDLVFLSDIMNNYKHNWNNDLYKSSSHVKVLDIRQEAEKKIFFYRDMISSVLAKQSLIHSDKDVQKQIDKIQADFKEYQLALYIHSFSSFLDVMLVGNFSSDYLTGIRQKIEEYSWEYKDLYTKCYNQFEEFFGSSIESKILKGLGKVSTVTGNAIAKVPIINKGSVDESLIKVGNKLEKISAKKSVQKMKKLVERQSSCARPFIENIETIERLYNNDMDMIFDMENIYLGVAEAKAE